MHTKVVDDPTIRWVADSWVDQTTPDDTVFSFLRIPFDYAVSHRPGTRFGPEGILTAFNGFSLYCTDKRVSLDHVRLVDLGRVDVVHSLPETYANITEAVARIPPEQHPVFLGGDHSIADPIFRGLLRRNPGRRFGLIVFDAHFDARPPIPGKEHSGHWMKTLEDVIDYSVTAQLGISAPIYSEYYMRSAEEQGVLVRTPYEIRRRGWRETLEEAISHVSRDTDGVYISVDIDCLDQAFAPGTSVPNGSGLLTHEVADAVFEISGAVPVVGIDINEVSPPLDRLDQTSQLAAHLLLNHMAGVVAGKWA
ncbi:agmatinase family protein [Protofrankia sp. BMG5.30]|uniref:Arginase n=1 Tax=Protofrankia coriariae TaxID=1562887 RepID=A0ABR5F7W4_9ACTN|nr:agmatinase family protein [Protofrankia sp. BMG5.30]KLL12708.1 arginase [Protofrankia coriariae]ONH36133.1 arginase [Protofrankia sp. BMG5.30]